MTHLTLFELADPNSDEVDLIMNDAWFLPTPVQIGDIHEYDGLSCKVLQTYSYTGSADFSLTLAIIYPSELEAPAKEAWFCNESAAQGLEQTRYLFLNDQNVLDVGSFYGFAGDALEPTEKTISLKRSWQMSGYSTFKCANSPFKHLYIAHCEQRVLQAA